MSTVTVDGKNVTRHDGEPLQESDPHVLVHAQRTSCINGIKEDVVVVFERIDGHGLPILSLCNGITGYESWYIDEEFIGRIKENGLIVERRVFEPFGEVVASQIDSETGAPGLHSDDRAASTTTPIFPGHTPTKQPPSLGSCTGSAGDPRSTASDRYH